MSREEKTERRFQVVDAVTANGAFPTKENPTRERAGIASMLRESPKHRDKQVHRQNPDE